MFHYSSNRWVALGATLLLGFSAKGAVQRTAEHATTLGVAAASSSQFGAPDQGVATVVPLPLFQSRLPSQVYQPPSQPVRVDLRTRSTIDAQGVSARRGALAPSGSLASYTQSAPANQATPQSRLVAPSAPNSTGEGRSAGPAAQYPAPSQIEQWPIDSRQAAVNPEIERVSHRRNGGIFQWPEGMRAKPVEEDPGPAELPVDNRTRALFRPMSSPSRPALQALAPTPPAVANPTPPVAGAPAPTPMPAVVDEIDASQPAPPNPHSPSVPQPNPAAPARVQATSTGAPAPTSSVGPSHPPAAPVSIDKLYERNKTRALLAPPTQNEGATLAQQYPGPKAPQPLFSVSRTPSATPVAAQSPPASGPRRSKALIPKSFFSKFKTDAAAATEPDLLSKIWPSNYPPGVRSIYSNPQRATAQPTRNPEVSSSATVTKPVKAPTAAVDTAQTSKSKETAADQLTHPAAQAVPSQVESKDAVATPAPSTQGEVADWRPSKRRPKTAKASQAKRSPVATSPLAVEKSSESNTEEPTPNSVVAESAPDEEESTVSIEKPARPEPAAVIALADKPHAIEKTPETDEARPAVAAAKPRPKPAKHWTKAEAAPPKQLSHREPDRDDSQPEIVEIHLGNSSGATSGSTKRRPIVIRRANDDKASVTRPDGGSFRRDNAEFDSVQANAVISRDTDDRDPDQAPSSSKSINPLRPAGPPLPSATWESEARIRCADTALRAVPLAANHIGNVEPSSTVRSLTLTSVPPIMPILSAKLPARRCREAPSRSAAARVFFSSRGIACFTALLGCWLY